MLPDGNTVRYRVKNKQGQGRGREAEKYRPTYKQILLVKTNYHPQQTAAAHPILVHCSAN